MVVVLGGSDRTGVPQGGLAWPHALRSFAIHHFYPVAVAIIFIVFAAVAAVVLWFFPDTRGKPLEEIAALFGDQDQVAVYQSELSNNKFMDDTATESGEPRRKDWENEVSVSHRDNA